MPRNWEPKRGDPKWLGGDRWKTTIHIPRRGDMPERQKTGNFEAKGIKAARIAQGDVQKRLRAEFEEEHRHEGTVHDLIVRWLAWKQRRWSPTTYYNAVKMMDAVKAALGHHPMDRLTARHLDEWYDLMLAKHSESTVGHYHALIHSMLKQGHKWGDVPGNVADLATAPSRKKRTKTHDTPTPEVLRAIIAAAPPDVLLAARMAASLGCRRGELVGLRWSDFHGGQVTISRNMIKVPKQPAQYKSTKTDDVRTLQVDEHIAAMLDGHKNRQDALFHRLGLPIPSDGPVFLNWRGKTAPHPRPPDWLTKAWTKLCAAEGVNVRFHALRHFTATQLLGSGHSLADVAKQLGHADPAVTARIYAHAMPKADTATAKTMGDILGLPPGQGSNLQPLA